jgi:hypothetical protein
LLRADLKTGGAQLLDEIDQFFGAGRFPDHS